MEYKYVIYEKKGNVATITLNYPEKLNVWDFPGQGGLVDDFHAALTEAEEDDDIKVMVMKGAGRAFSGGHDISKVGFIYGMGTGQSGERRASQRIRLKVDLDFISAKHLRVLLFPKITIAQVHGYCVGEGTLYVNLCDFAIVTEDAKIGFFDQRMGFAGSGRGDINLLMATVGHKRALDLMINPRLIDGNEAERIGLVSKAVPADKLEEEVEALCKVICFQPADGIAIGKAQRRLAYESMGITAGFAQGAILHTLFTNLQYKEGEFNFFKQRREEGTGSAIKNRNVILREAGI